MTLGKVIAVDGVPVEIRKSAELRKNFAAPATVGERAADTEQQRAHRELIARQRALEREQTTLYSVFHSHGVSRARQMQVSARLDEVEAELASLRTVLAGAGVFQRVAKSDGLTDAERGANALATIMHQPSIKKNELPDVFELSNGVGIRSQTRIKE